MKKLYTFLVVVLITLSSSAQIVNIPDANFKTKLLAASPTNIIAKNSGGQYIKIDTNNDNEIQVTEAQLVYTLYIPNSNIVNLTGIESFSNLRSLMCALNQLTTLNISNLNYLQTLNCSQNQISELNLLNNPNLLNLDCKLNAISSLDFSNTNNIQNIECYGNQLTSLDVSNKISLQTLNCNNNQISNLNVLNCQAITTLICNSNPLINLNVSSLTNLLQLNCYTNQLTSLNILNNPNLTYLDCSNNNITTIDFSNSNNLQTLYVDRNQLTSLEVSNKPSLSLLDCGFNPLSTLNLSNIPILGMLKTYSTNLTEIDVSSFPNVWQLDTKNCPLLTNVNIKNGKSTSTVNYINGCPNLSYICADEGELSSIQSTITANGYTNCHVNTYCSFVPGGVFYTISGNTSFDSNNNGCDVNDLNIANQKITISSGSVTGSLIANQSGVYSIPIQAGTHTLTPVFENPGYFTASPTTTTVTFPATASPFTQDFCVTANGVHNDVELTVLPIFVARPGFDATYKIIYKNKGNQISNGTVNLNFNDAVMDLVSALPINTSSATNSLNWAYSNLNPFETREINLTFNINSPMETPAVNAGTILNYTATIIGATDEMPSDNTFTLNQTVVNSYDPNDKTCLEGTTITPSMVGQYVHYVIRFENTGTFPAQNVIVTDMINATKFDIASLVTQSSSHWFVTRINSTTGKVEFIFENINLPFDDADNDGYVAFKIKTKPTLMLGNTFSNTANIYFDYNFPIVTNTATTTIATLANQDFDFGSYFTVYPVPAKDVLHLNTKNEIGLKSLSIYNILGQMVLAVTHPENNATIDVANLKTGTYFIKVITDKGTANTKFIKE